MEIRVYYFGPKGAHTPQRRPAHALLLQTSWALKRILDTLKRTRDTLKRILDALKRILETLKRTLETLNRHPWAVPLLFCALTLLWGAAAEARFSEWHSRLRQDTTEFKTPAPSPTRGRSWRSCVSCGSPRRHT